MNNMNAYIIFCEVLCQKNYTRARNNNNNDNNRLLPVYDNKLGAIDFSR